MFVVGPNPDDLLVERRGFGPEAFAAQAVGDAGELRDRLVALAGAQVEVAEHVGGAPVPRLILDDAQVLGDRRVELPLSEQLLGISQGQGAINSHVTTLRVRTDRPEEKISDREASY